jgi:hypothetical protein
MDRSTVARFVYEVCHTAQLPNIIYGNAMMIYHAFMEYTEHTDEEPLLAAACVLLAAKFGESILNSYSRFTTGRVRVSGAVIDATARVLLWYGEATPENTTISVETLAEVRRYVGKCIGDMELSVLKITGNYLTSIPSAFQFSNDQRLVNVYASPDCLNYPPAELVSRLEGAS